jgi:hypothetical protein
MQLLHVDLVVALHEQLQYKGTITHGAAYAICRDLPRFARLLQKIDELKGIRVNRRI